MPSNNPIKESPVRTNIASESSNISDRNQLLLEHYERLAGEKKEFTFLLDITNNVTYVSASVWDLLGYTPEEFSQINIFNNHPQETLNAIAQEFIFRKNNPESTKINTLQVNLVHKLGHSPAFKLICTPTLTEEKVFNGLAITAVLQKTPASKNEPLKNNLEHLIDQFESISEFIWFIDKDLNITFLNNAFKQEFKRAYNELLEPGMYIIDYLPTIEQKKWKQRYKKALLGEKFDTTDHIIFGEFEIFIETNFNPIIVNQKVIGVACFSHDVSKRKQAELALLESEAQFRDFFENSRSSITIQTKDRYLRVNKSWERITGYTKEEAKNMHPIDLVHPSHRNIVGNLSAKRFKGEADIWEYDFDIITKSGQTKRVNVNIQKIKYKGEQASLISANVIKNQKTVEKELQKLSTAVMHSPISIIITNIKGQIEYANPFFTNFTGYSLDEVIGKNPRILKSGNHSKADYKKLWDTILSGNIWHGEFENIKKNGDHYFESASIAPILNDNNEITNFIAIKKDITKEKEDKEKLQRSELNLRFLNSKKDQFFSIISHDLRGPLGAIYSLTHLLKDNYKSYTEQEMSTFLHELESTTGNVFKLTENLLHWAKTQSGRIDFEPRFLCLSTLLDNAIELLNATLKQKDIHVEKNADPNLCLMVDENMIATIFRNLLSNAIKYSHQKQSIEITFSEQRDDVLVSVADKGVGIPKSEQNKLFKIEDNYTSLGTGNEKGTGLGLVLCKEFIELHGGKIWFKSEEGKGTTFFFTIPFKQKTSTQN